jgi:hypothetical protein
MYLAFNFSWKFKLFGKISLNIAFLVDFSHFLQKFDNLEQKKFWPKICGFGP